ncbi:MAG: hypothetical protein KDE55_04190 [Novosphingobium sp.]|nr:hypothetical protein [Novosphingobium sp.]
MKNLVLFGCCALLSACGSDPQPGGVTVEESRALDEAAEMIEARRLPPEALVPSSDVPAEAEKAEPKP